MSLSLIKIFHITFLVVILIIAAISDINSRKIPNWLTFPAMAVGIAYHTYIKGYQGFIFSIKGILAGFALLMLFYIMGGTGAGDVKLLGAVGGLLGPFGVLKAFLFAGVIGGIYAVITMVLHNISIKDIINIKDKVKRYKTMLKTFIYTQRFVYIPPENKWKMPVLCYGAVIALGTLISLIVPL